GILGALVARVAGDQVRRMPLALVCGVAGLIYGVILDFSTWVTFSGDQSLAKYLAISAASLPFNIAHAIGNVVFFLAFGPGLIRAVQRCRARFEVVWRPVGAVLPLRAVGESRGIAAAARWIARQANRDGGFNVYRRGGPSNPDDTAGAVQALVAAGRGSTPTVRRAVRYLRRAQHRDGGYALSLG